MAHPVKGAPAHDDIPLVAHVVYSFGCGGLQTLLAECINRMLAAHYRHAIICLTPAKDYADRIDRPDVVFHDLHKPPGNSIATHVRLWRLLRRLRPAVLHTYNVGTIEYNATAWLAGVPVRIHAEHGRDSVEIDGRHRRYNVLRRLLIPVVDAYVPVSNDLVDWLRGTVGIPEKKIAMVINGVDTARYAPAPGPAAAPPTIWIGTVGRADRIKNHAGLLDIFERVLARFPGSEYDLRLAIVGDGPLLETLRSRVAAQAWGDRVWLPGARGDIAGLLRTFSVFVLPSLSEASPVVVLEAMASALPVVASRVGGLPQLVLDGETGALADAADVEAFADAIARYIRDPELRLAHGAAGRSHVQAGFSMDAMVAGYDALYSRHLARKKRWPVLFRRLRA